MSNHTPGPWRVAKDDVPDDVHREEDVCLGHPEFSAISILFDAHDRKNSPDRSSICAKSEEEHKANARLIAKAPEMFELLKTLVAALGEATLEYIPNSLDDQGVAGSMSRFADFVINQPVREAKALIAEIEEDES